MLPDPVKDEAIEFKERGNDAFKMGDWTNAVEEYTKAIKYGKEHKQLATFYKNRAAAYLKLEKYELAARDCDKSLELEPNEPKALFRRSQAREELGRFEEAYKDLVTVWNADKSDKSVKHNLERLHEIVQRRATENAQTFNKVQKMMELAFTMEKPTDTRVSAMNNILVLCREPTGAELLYKEGVVRKIMNLVKYEKNQEIYVNAIRSIGEVCNKSLERTRGVLQVIGIPWFLQVLNNDSSQVVNAVQHCIQTILNSYSGMDNKLDSKPDQNLCEENRSEIDSVLTSLVYSITEPTISGLARDAIIEIITRNVHHNAINWAEQMVEIKGLHRLLRVCSEIEEYKTESSMNITPSSRTIAAVCLSRIYDNMYYDAARQRFTEQVDEFIKNKLLDPEIEEKVRVVVVITSILACAVDFGSSIISREGRQNIISYSE